MLSFSEIAALKNLIKTQSGIALHFHDVCPRPYFTLDKTDFITQSIIDTFLSAKQYYAVYSSDGLHFTIERNHSC